jgi:hypothetical protein
MTDKQIETLRQYCMYTKTSFVKANYRFCFAVTVSVEHFGWGGGLAPERVRTWKLRKECLFLSGVKPRRFSPESATSVTPLPQFVSCVADAECKIVLCSLQRKRIELVGQSGILGANYCDWGFLRFLSVLPDKWQLGHNSQNSLLSSSLLTMIQYIEL